MNLSIKTMLTNSIKANNCDYYAEDFKYLLKYFNNLVLLEFISINKIEMYINSFCKNISKIEIIDTKTIKTPKSIIKNNIIEIHCDKYNKNLIEINMYRSITEVLIGEKHKNYAFSEVLLEIIAEIILNNNSNYNDGSFEKTTIIKEHRVLKNSMYYKLYIVMLLQMLSFTDKSLYEFIKLSFSSTIFVVEENLRQDFTKKLVDEKQYDNLLLLFEQSFREHIRRKTNIISNIFIEEKNINEFQKKLGEFFVNNIDKNKDKFEEFFELLSSITLKQECIDNIKQKI